MSEPVNVPGTLDEYPNWRRKLTATLDELFSDETVRDLIRRIRELRPPKSGSGPDIPD
jgi:4-alpha-glucanotransferase